MPTVEENFDMWDRRFAWSTAGAEWSAPWGGVEAQWQASLLPRISPFVPVPIILEIGPGFGRWTQFLVQLCDHYMGVDLSPKCVEACRARFLELGVADFFVNDGRSLESVHRSVDFAFSLDSLVHAEHDVIEAYLRELAVKLSPDGIALLHHSNLGALAPDLSDEENVHWRARSMSATRFEELCAIAGLICVGQELISVDDTSELLDCLSLVTRPGSKFERPNVVVENHWFTAEANSAWSRSQVYEFDLPPRGLRG